MWIGVESRVPIRRSAEDTGTFHRSGIDKRRFDRDRIGPRSTRQANLFDLVGRTLRFSPASSGYRVTNQPLQWEADYGGELTSSVVSLQRFTFPFSGQRWSSFSVETTGSIRFGPPAKEGDVDAYGRLDGGIASAIGRFDRLADAGGRLASGKATGDQEARAMNRRVTLWSGLGAVALGAAGGGAWILSLPAAPAPTVAAPIEKEEADATLAGLKPPKRQRPLIPLRSSASTTPPRSPTISCPMASSGASGVADVVLLSTVKGPVKLDPALAVEPHATGRGVRCATSGRR